MKKKTIAFNPDTMKVSDLKDAARSLGDILRAFEMNPDNMDMLWTRVATISEAWQTYTKADEENKS